MYLVPFFWQFFISIKIFLILCTSCLCQHYIVFFKQLWRKIKQNDVKFLHPFLHLYFGHMMSFFFSYVFRTCQVPTKDPNSEYIAVVKPLKKINASLCDNNHVKHNLEQFFFYQVFAYQSFEFYSPGQAIICRIYVKSNLAIFEGIQQQYLSCWRPEYWFIVENSTF